MRFVETPVFTRVISALLDDDQYRNLQLSLLLQPDLGSVIPRSGGLRKLRWSLTGRGKRGGMRMIYYWHQATETFYMLYAFKKNAQQDLTARQLRLLAQLVREELG